MRMRPFSLLVVLVLLAACGAGDDSDDDSTRGAQTTTSTRAGADPADDDDGESAADTGSGPEVEVLDAGDEPRVELRIRPRAGDKQELTIRQEQVQEMTVGAQTQSVQSITEMDVAYFIDDVTSDRITARVVYEDARLVDADATARPMLEQVLAAFVGLEGEVVFDDRGRILESDLPDVELPDLPGGEQLLESLESQLANLAVPFPEEPLGAGARWTTTSTAEFAGILALETRYTLTLTEVTDEAVTAEVAVELVFSGVEGGPLQVLESDLTGGGRHVGPRRARPPGRPVGPGHRRHGRAGAADRAVPVPADTHDRPLSGRAQPS